MKLEAISSAKLREIIETEFRFSSSSTAFQLGFIAEHLRAIVTLEAQNCSNNDRYPISTQRLCHHVRTRLISLGQNYSEPLQTTVEELDHLARLSDLIKFDGRWSLGPLRRVGIDDASCLLIGGSASHSLPPRLRTSIQVAGRARILHFSEKALSLTEQIPIQRFDDWLGFPYRNIGEWRSAFLKASIKSLSQPFEMESAVFWIGERWLTIERYCGDVEWLLFRKSVAIFGNPTSEYGIARVKANANKPPTIVGIREIERNDARRLQGTLLGNSAVKRYLKYFCSGELVVIRIPHPLPFPESNFLSLGWTSTASDTVKVWPKDFVFASILLPLLGRILASLGYELIQNYVGEIHEN